MKTILINYFEDGGVNHFKGFAEVSESGIYYHDNYSNRTENLKSLIETFLDKYINYLPEGEREGLRNLLNEYYDEHIDEFEEIVIEIFERFRDLDIENVEFNIADTPMPKICTLRQENGKDIEFEESYLGDKRTSIISAVDEDFEDEYNAFCNEIRDYYENYGVNLEDLGIDVANIINVKKMNKKALLAIVTAGCVLFGGLGGFGISKVMKGSSNIKDEPAEEIVTETLRPDEISLPTEAPTITSTPTVEPTVSLPTVAPTEVPYIPQIEHYFQNPSTDPSVVSYTLLPDHDEPHKITEDKFNDYSTMLMQSYDSFTDMTNYLYHHDAWGDLRTLGVTIDFEKYFSNFNEIDRGYIKYFSDLRNDIIYYFYRFMDYDAAIRYNNEIALPEMLRCIRDNGFVNINPNGEPVYVRFSDLSYDAQNVVLDIVFNFQTFMTTNTITYNNETYTSDDMLTEVFGVEPDHPTLG